MQFIYVGRLDKEKGIEALLYCIQRLHDRPEIHFHIYGKGEYTNTVQDLAKQYPDILSYYGRQNKKDISKQRSECDFFIMPSTFLETFGLTACESLLLGVPVIGNKKGGLIPFIDDRLDIQAQTGTHDSEKLLAVIEQLIHHKSNKKDYSELIQQTQQTYTKQQRYNSIKNIIKHERSIILISDFINYNGGGIETHIHDSKEILTENNNTVSLYGHQAPSGKRSRVKKLRTMGRSIANIYDSIRITKVIKKERIGLIRRHSISRVIGWLPVLVTQKTKQIITHHELGLFHPYPSKVTAIDQLPQARSRYAFIESGQNKSFLGKISIAAKYLLIWLIHKQLQTHTHTHIVPSERMIDIIKRRHPKSKVICIPHFVSIQE